MTKRVVDFKTGEETIEPYTKKDLEGFEEMRAEEAETFQRLHGEGKLSKETVDALRKDGRLSMEGKAQ